MKRSKISLIAGIVAVVMLVSTAAWAYPAFMKTFTDTYKIDKNSALGKARCGVCHPSATQTSKLNAYGQDLQKLMKSDKCSALTAAVLKKAESPDSDKDGATNIQEIKAGTLPGDAKSTPKKG